MIIVDLLSLTAVPITMLFDKTEISIGTGFFWSRGSKLYLVSNWHNFSGIDPTTGKHLSTKLAEPNRVVFDFFARGNVGSRGWHRVLLRNTDGEPLWLEHPTHREAVDVACLELDFDKGDFFPINEHANNKGMKVSIGMDAFVLGFPLGVGPSRFPIWKRCSIATEPDIDVDDLPLFYVDTATAKGMSGAPVVLRSSSPVMEGGSQALYDGFTSRFIGVYSGRHMTGGPMDAQLGRVWKAGTIDQIIAGVVHE